MIKHIVMWRLKDHAEGHDKATNAQLMKSKLEALRGQIDGVLAIEVGIDLSATDASMDVALYSEFADRAALAVYQAHPAHQAVVAFIKEVVNARQLVDYEV